MKREDIDAMEVKARAALEEMPQEFCGARWTFDVDLGRVSALVDGVTGMRRMDMVTPAQWGVKHSALQHIAASDPHAVLALIAELRRVEQERDEERAHAERLVAALDPVRPLLRNIRRPYWDETEVARHGTRLYMTLPQTRELAAACDAADPEPPLRNAD